MDCLKINVHFFLIFHLLLKFFNIKFLNYFEYFFVQFLHFIFIYYFIKIITIKNINLDL